MVLVVSRSLHFSLRLIVWVNQSDGTNSNFKLFAVPEVPVGGVTSV
jgi:hypothetical protein